ncbi:hypothetical protein D3C84_1275450 [compost metagenome]
MQVEALGEHRARAVWTIQAEPYTGGRDALPGFQAFLQGFADDAMNNVRNLLE